jgi:alginate O-acetyltransferase complex protein AlgI
LTEKYVISRIKIFKPIGHIITMFLVIIGWVIFSSDTIGQIGVSLSAMFGNASLGLCDAATLYQLKTYAVLLVLCAFFSLPFGGRITEKLKGRHPLMVSIMMTVMFVYCIALLVTSNYNPFLYFRF